MPCLNSDQWIASGEAQIAAANLTGAAKTQARLSLLLANPYNHNLPANSGAPINSNFPYFIVSSDGCPEMIIPPGFNIAPVAENITLPALAAPPQTSDAVSSILVPSGEPCPQGFVSSPSQQPLSETIPVQLAASVPRVTTDSGACKPQIVVAAQQMITKNDFLRVSAASIYNDGVDPSTTVPLTVHVRLLTCAGEIQIMESTLNLVHTVDAGAAQGAICFPLTDGYLLSVVASGAPFCVNPGEVWVQGEIRNQSCTGTINIPLFSGYMADQMFVGWPGGQNVPWGQGNGAPHGSDMGTSFIPEPSFGIEQGSVAVIKQVVLDYTSSATAGSRVPILIWSPPAGGENVYISNQSSQPASMHYLWCWGIGLQPGTMAGLLTSGGSTVYDAIVHVPLPEFLRGDVQSELVMQINHADTHADVIHSCGVLYEAWAEPAADGF